jgi:hypothetical protein
MKAVMAGLPDCVCICYTPYARIDFGVTFIGDDRVNRFGGVGI